MTDLCLIHANCQGEILASLLGQAPTFTKLFHIRTYTNYTGEEISENDLQSCRLFLYQYLDEKWGSIASKNLLPKLSPKAQAIRIPNLFFLGYWPFWCHSPAIDFADRLLETLLELNLPTQEILRIYLNGVHPLFATVEAKAMSSLLQEKNKEQESPIKVVHILESDWRDEQLFYTVNHPGKRLCLAVAEELLRLINLAPLPREVALHFEPEESAFVLPIHPVVGERLKLSFVSAQTRYPAFGNTITHKDFVLCYLSCRLNNVQNISAFLYDRKKSS